MTGYCNFIHKGSDECEIKSIKEAIQKSNSGGVILVNSGIYYEGNIIIDKTLSLIGINRPVIDADLTNEAITINAGNVIISGFQIQNVGTNYMTDLAGININRVDSCVIENNLLVNTFFTIYVQRAKGTIIRNNTITGTAVNEISSGNAIHLWHCENALIENNIAKLHRDGIYLEFVNNTRIINNISEGNLRYGLHFMFSNQNEYLKNTFQSNGAGVAVMFSKEILMDSNNFLDNWGSASYGLLLKEIYDGTISNNFFTANTVGIYGESVNRLKIINNDFSKNGWAMRILGSCMDNTFSANNFESNTFDLATNSGSNSNVFTENYWSEYSGYDLDKDGFGDVPHKPVNLFSYIVERIPESVILLRSMFIDLLNFAEKITPIFTPENLTDERPLMKKILR
ncbi:MAG: nitrous oxide reductase family maturation protein NosD [Bacteroidetes bacterium]|nr:nitrous oxide reductase family maturation protein NosD [Bacteroidota bacterium]